MKRPNVVLFLTDDHGAWANGFTGNCEVRTPALNKLAREGVWFRNAFTPTPVCSPARACLLTGQTASQVGIHDWLQEADEGIAERDWLDGTPTLFDWFQAAGYQTALCGKWHLGRSHLAPSGADYHFGLPGWQGHHNTEYTYVLNGQRVALEGNKSTLITDHALQYLDGVAPDRPFFLNIGYIATHSPYGRQHHDPVQVAAYEKSTFHDIPDYVPHPWAKNEDGPGDPPTAEALRDRYIGYYAAVSEIDQNVGRVVDKLAAMGLLDDTIIIYTSDHGCSLGHQGFWGKGNSTRPLNMYEISLRVPLVWRGPGIRAEGIQTSYVDHYDTFMTLVEMCHLGPAPEGEYPGHSYLPALAGQEMEWDDVCFGEYGDLRMVRTPRWKLVWRYPDGPHDLFDLAHDPFEQNNLYGDPGLRDIVDNLSQRLAAFYEQVETPEKSGYRVKELPRHNREAEAWRDGRREAQGLQIY